ncbi:MAG TPA: type III pantothenate kinase [Anaerolineaceae bacterium]|nr:type III pantothenate kinase [Anaerolineaceae bacterium]
MLLTIDIGNTNITLGTFEDGKLTNHWRLATDPARMPDEYGLQLLGLLHSRGLHLNNLSDVVLASVVPPLTSHIQEAVREYLSKSPVIIESQHCSPIVNRYDPPQAVGIDRLVNAVAVEKKYGLPACVVDFGTATTFDAIDRDYNYLGGAIAPGVGISLDALVSHTAKLPKVDLQLPEHVIGRNTTQAMQSGLLWGYIAMVEGMVARFRAELGEDTQVIATGGLAALVGSHTASIAAIDPWLTLEGLYLIWERMHP